MHPAELISLIPGLDHSIGKKSPDFHIKDEEEAPESFLQVWMKASEGNEAQVSVNPVVGEEGIEGLNPQDILPEDVLMEMVSPGGSRPSLQAEGRRKGIETEPGVIAVPLTANMTTLIKSSFPSSGAEEMGLPQAVGSASSIDSREMRSTTASDIERSLPLARFGERTVAHRAVPLGKEISATKPSDRLNPPGINPAVFVDSEASGRIPVQGMEASTFLDPLNPETGKHPAVIAGTVPVVDLRPENLGKPGSDPTLRFDLDGKGNGGIKSLSSNGSGVTDFDGGSGGQLPGKEGGELSPFPLDPIPSEEFSAMIRVNSEPGFDRPVQGQVHITESRSPDAFFSEKMLLRQVAQNLQNWQPQDGEVLRFQLEPETLGMLQLDISIHENGLVARIITEHHFVKTLLEQNQEMLHEALSAKGLSVEHFSVNVGTPDRHGADRQDSRQDLEVPRPFLDQEEGILPLDAGRIRPSGDHRINLYV